jgi:type II secretory pathway component PulC
MRRVQGIPAVAVALVAMAIAMTGGSARAEARDADLAARLGGGAAPVGKAAADPAPAGLEEPYAPLRAVAVMLDCGQALLWDEAAGKYRLAEVGDVVDGWKVVSIQADLVVVTHGQERDELALAPAPRAVSFAQGKTEKPAPAPASPTVSAPAMPAAPAPTPVAPPPVVKPRPAPAPVDSTPDKVVVRRAELDRELGDFDKISKSVDFAPADGGGFVVTRLEKGSWLWRMGLRTGDVVRAVAGERVASVDDVARVYARLRSIKDFTVEVDRPVDGAAPARVVLRYEITK